MPSSSTTQVTEGCPRFRGDAFHPSREALAQGLLALSLVTWIGVGLSMRSQSAFSKPTERCHDGLWVMDRSVSPSAVRCARGALGPNEHPMGGAPGLLFAIPLDLNSAEPRDLVAVPGIGPARAEAVVAARRDAPYTSLVDVTRARGVGNGTLARIREWVTVSESREPQAEKGTGQTSSQRAQSYERAPGGTL